MNDEQEIRKLIETWMSASKAGDMQTILDLMTDDVVFMTPGREPFGKEEFRKTSERMKDLKIDGENEIIEIKVFGDFAYIRNYLKIITTVPGEKPLHRSGYTLTILRKENGKWKLARDANLLT